MNLIKAGAIAIFSLGTLFAVPATAAPVSAAGGLTEQSATSDISQVRYHRYYGRPVPRGRYYGPRRGPVYGYRPGPRYGYRGYGYQRRYRY